MLRYPLRYTLFLIALDALIVGIALALSSVLRTAIDLGAEALTPPGFAVPPLLYPIALLLWSFAFEQAGVYRPDAHHSVRGLMRRLIIGHLMGGLLFFGALYLTFRDFSRLQALYFIGLLFLFTVVQRILLLRLRPRLGDAISPPRAVLIVGVDGAARHLGEMIAGSQGVGLRWIGCVAPTPEAPADRALADAGRILGTVDDLGAIARQRTIDEVVIAARWLDEATAELVARVARAVGDQPINIRLAHDFNKLAYFRAKSEDFGGMTLISLREPIMTPAERVFKRGFDVAFSAAALVFSAPLWLAIAIAIRLDSPGSIFFRQTRVGQHGRRFTIVKFRTMIVDAEAGIDPRRSAKREDDPRVTRVGRFLRRTSLDELPQFLNVLRGEMSVVGPRPEILSLAEGYEPWQRKRFEVPQGITGWWQVNGRSDRPMQAHTEDDLFYVRNYSVWLDLRIIARTIIAWISGRGAY